MDFPKRNIKDFDVQACNVDYSRKELFDIKPETLVENKQVLNRKIAKNQINTDINKKINIFKIETPQIKEIVGNSSPFSTLLLMKSQKSKEKSNLRLKNKTFISSKLQNKAQNNKRQVSKEQTLKKLSKVDLEDQKKILIINNKLERLAYADFNNKLKISYIISNQLNGKRRIFNQNLNSKEFKKKKSNVLEFKLEEDEDLSKVSELTGYLGKNLVKNVCQVLNVSKETKNVFLENKNQIKRHSHNNNMGNKSDLNLRNKVTFLTDNKFKIKLEYKDKKQFSEGEFNDKNLPSENKNFYKVEYDEGNNPNFFKKKKKRLLKKIDKIFDSSDEKTVKFLIKSKFVISHLSCFRKIWDLIIFFGCLFTIFVIPFWISFPELEKSGIIILQSLVEILFLFENILNFFTSYNDHEENDILNIYLIIPHYLENYFFLDLISSFPVNTIYLLLEKDFLLFKFLNCHFQLRSLRWLSLIRISKFSNEQLSGRYFKSMVKLFKFKMSHLYTFAFYFLSLVHITTCFFIFIGKSCINNHNWLSNFGDSNHLEIYLCSFYYNLVTIYTIGYGDIIPVNNVEAIYICFFMLISNFLYSYGISSLSQIFSNNNKDYTYLREKKNILDSINDEFCLPENLYKNINQDLKNQFKKIGGIERYEFLDSLPTGLKNELIMIIYKNKIKHQSYFRNQSYEFVLYVLPLLKSQIVQKGEKLYTVREYVEEMYLVTTGLLSLTLGEYFNNLEIGIIRYNEHFGDLFLQLNGQSPYDLICKSTNAELLVLTKSDYLKVKNSFMESSQNILEESYKLLEILDRRRNSFIKVFHLWNSSKLVKKKMLELNIFLMNEGFTEFYDSGLDFQEAHEVLRVMEEDKIISLFHDIEKKEIKSPKNTELIEISKNESLNQDPQINTTKDSKKNSILVAFSVKSKKFFENSILKSLAFTGVKSEKDHSETSENIPISLKENTKNNSLSLENHGILSKSSNYSPNEKLSSKKLLSKQYVKKPLPLNFQGKVGFSISEIKDPSPSNSKKVIKNMKGKAFDILNLNFEDKSKKQEILERENELNNKTLKLLNLHNEAKQSNNQNERKLSLIVKEEDEKLENETILHIHNSCFEILSFGNKSFNSEKLKLFKCNDIFIRNNFKKIDSGSHLIQENCNSEFSFNNEFINKDDIFKSSQVFQNFINIEVKEINNEGDNQIPFESYCPEIRNESVPKINSDSRENIIDLKLTNILGILKCKFTNRKNYTSQSID